MRTHLDISYGFRTPIDLVEKLERERSKFSSPPDRDEIFNFMITGHSLYDWVRKTFDHEINMVGFKDTGKGKWCVPKSTAAYILDTDDVGMVPNAPDDEKCQYIKDCLGICQGIANASKHYEWHETITDISEKPLIADAYQYFFTAVEEDIYVTIDERHYGVTQIASIVIQFYRGLLQELEKIKSNT